MSSRKKLALLGSLLRGASPQDVRALVTVFLLVGGTSALSACDRNQHVGPCLSVEVVEPGETTEPGAGRSPTMTAPANTTPDAGEDLHVGPCLEIAPPPEDMGEEKDQSNSLLAPRKTKPEPIDGVSNQPCLSMIDPETERRMRYAEPPPSSKKPKKLEEGKDDGASLEFPHHEDEASPARTREEVLERLGGNLPADVLARLREELDKKA